MGMLDAVEAEADLQHLEHLEPVVAAVMG